MQNPSHVPDLDVLIVGGGGAGLWLLDELRRAGYSVLLAEATALGTGQTMATQGIIHGGLKYALGGIVGDSADAIKDMPVIWRECLAGLREPNLSKARMRSDSCVLWRTDGIASKIGMLGARGLLRVAPVRLEAADQPSILAGCVSEVFRLDEQVIEPGSFVEVLAERNQDHLVRVSRVAFDATGPGEVASVRLVSPDGSQEACVHPIRVVLTAGEGNAALREACGLSGTAMQRRPLHFPVAKGMLPVLNGHCIDGGKTRMTITTQDCRDGERVWQLGGSPSEQGVDWEPEELFTRVRLELAAVLPGVQLPPLRFASFRIDRAEGATSDGTRPSDPCIVEDGTVITAWPTKLAFAPLLAEQVRGRLPEPTGVRPASDALLNWPRPAVAPYPWERLF
jgi:hypothetical protein